MVNLSGYFAGNGTLLIQCAQTFTEAGGSIQAIATSNQQIIDWANRKGYPISGTTDAPDFTEAGADYLFSVANLSILGEAVLRCARVMAINFHDGPLPGRSGSNVPAWAILEGETEHAISWHQMQNLVDAGAVLKSRSFAISPNDTAFDLNLRCYEAGQETFRELIADIVAGKLHPVTAPGERKWYARAKRPEGLGLLDLTLPCCEILRTVRALNFGAHRNPLTLPKLWTGKKVVVVRGSEPANGAGGIAGQVIDFDSASLTIMAGDGVLRLSGITDMRGQPVKLKECGVAPGVVLPRPQLADAATAHAAGASENFWEAALKKAAAPLPPYQHCHLAEAFSVPLDITDPNVRLLASAWLGWTAMLNARPRASVAVRLPGQAVNPAFDDRMLVTVDCGPQTTPRQIADALDSVLSTTMAQAPMPVDLPLRMEDEVAQQAALGALGVCIADTHSPQGVASDLEITVNPPRLSVRSGLFNGATLSDMATDFGIFCKAFQQDLEQPVALLPMGADLSPLAEGAPASVARNICDAFTAALRANPDAVAVQYGNRRLTFAELDTRSNNLAGALSAEGAGLGKVVGLYLDRSENLVVAVLAILKTGATYLPLDPAYPQDRITFMLEDSQASLVVAEKDAMLPASLAAARVVSPDEGKPFAGAKISPQDMAYLIYTSGSTGKPKGVMIQHRNVSNFFAGMDAAVPISEASRLLAVTSISFDISVLELLWTLSRGATVVLQDQSAQLGSIPSFSLFYFASQAGKPGSEAYRVLIEGAKFADKNGFEAIWTPERHFHAFGGLYPNPAISSAALALITRNIKLRAGSVVTPLHHPVSIAENWALVDNLSNGRAGIAIASGWQPNDFVLRPDAFADRKTTAMDSVDTLRRLWKGETLEFPGHDGKPVGVSIHPRPVQDDLPLWLTAAGNVETFIEAGRKNCGVLTHLLGQTLDELGSKINAYRNARAAAGHDGPGDMVLMLHTFVAEKEETVLKTARGPMKGYLKSAVDLMRRASWTFPTFVQRASETGMSPQDLFDKQNLTAEELDALLDHAFERYYHTAGLFGTSESAKEIVRKVAAIGVSEIACLIDFGIDTETVLANLKHIKILMDELKQANNIVVRKSSVSDDIIAHGITHLQCTPTMAAYLTADTTGHRALAQLQCLMVGGEALPSDLAQNLRTHMSGALLNMYGPTETTIWSSVARLDQVGERIPLGKPITDTILSVRTLAGTPVPHGVVGELWIGGAGVSPGYWQRPKLTAERFVETPEGRFYRTGDLARLHKDGTLEFLGRADNQVKIRGHRIELSEIEALTAEFENVGQAAVSAVEFSPNDLRLVAYVTPSAATKPDTRALMMHLARRLPDFMLPSQIIVLDTMPLTPNGKLDRRALPVPVAASERGPFVAAENEIEAAVAEIWRDSLGLTKISMVGNFFDLGGHSLLVVQVQRRMKERFKRDIAITDIFRFPTVRAIAAHLSNEHQNAPNAAHRGSARAAARLARMGRQ